MRFHAAASLSARSSGPARLRAPGSQAVTRPPGGPRGQPVDSLDAVIRDPGSIMFYIGLYFNKIVGINWLFIN